MRDPADDVKESLAAITGRRDAMIRGRPGVETSVRRLRIALASEEERLRKYDETIKTLDTVIERGGKRNHIEIPVERVVEAVGDKTH